MYVYKFWKECIITALIGYPVRRGVCFYTVTMAQREMQALLIAFGMAWDQGRVHYIGGTRCFATRDLLVPTRASDSNWVRAPQAQVSRGCIWISRIR